MNDKIILYNPAISSMNKGDHIIFDSVRKQLCQMFPESSFYELPTQMPVSKRVLKWYSDIDLRFVCGTNLLKNDMLYEMGRRPHFKGVRQWDIELKNKKMYGPVVLLGCGWQKYQKGKDRYSEKLWNMLLDTGYSHSVRDSFTKEKLSELGINNVINTGCPTLWSLSKEHCKCIPTEKASRVITTVTDYHKDEKSDQRMLDTLLENYEKVYLWLQGYNDGDYVRSLNLHDKVTVISGGLDAYDRILEEDDIEYVGTRLHGGIRALQHKKRAVFVAVDNRTIEMGRDIGLNYLERKHINDLGDYIKTGHSNELALPEDEIMRFKSQFGEIEK